jgi:hypothetical protein
MEVKGTALKTTRDFIKTQFPDLYGKWLDSLPADSKKFTPPDATAWYPFREGYSIPEEK